MGPNGGQLLVKGKPYLILGGELGNSSAGTAAQADTILPRLASIHVSTVLMPVAWEELEPTEGHFDYTILDHWIAVAREQHMHFVVLWFGSWKNSFSNYAPAWIKQDTRRFPRAISVDGQQLEILSTIAPKPNTRTLAPTPLSFNTSTTMTATSKQSSWSRSRTKSATSDRDATVPHSPTALPRRGAP